MNAIDLGVKAPESVSAQAPAGEDNVHYPSLYIDSDQPLPDLPAEGTMTIAFKRGSKSMNESAEGDQRHSVSIEVTQILSVEGSEGDEQSEQETNDEDTEATLDKYAAEEVASKKPAADEEEE